MIKYRTKIRRVKVGVWSGVCRHCPEKVYGHRDTCQRWASDHRSQHAAGLI